MAAGRQFGVEEERVLASGQDEEPSSEAAGLDGDEQVLHVAFRVAQHVLGEAWVVDAQQGEAQLLGEVPLGVEVDEADLVPYFGEGLSDSGRDGGLADAALLVSEDGPSGSCGAGGTAGRRMGIEPKPDRLSEPLGERDAAVLAVSLEVPVEARGEVGGEGAAPGGIDWGELLRCPPGTKALGHGVLDIDAQLGSADLQFTSKRRRKLRHYLFPIFGVIWSGHGGTLLTPGEWARTEDAC